MKKQDLSQCSEISLVATFSYSNGFGNGASGFLFNEILEHIQQHPNIKQANFYVKSTYGIYKDNYERVRKLSETVEIRFFA